MRYLIRHNIAHAYCSVVFVGYDAMGVLARAIIVGAESIKLFDGAHLCPGAYPNDQRLLGACRAVRAA